MFDFKQINIPRNNIKFIVIKMFYLFVIVVCFRETLDLYSTLFY